MSEPGRVVVLNGAPRSGKSSIARALQRAAAEPWMNLGVDAVGEITPPSLRPGIGLRPGGERPDLEDHVLHTYAWLWDTVAAVARRGTSVVVDVGLHDDHSRPLGLVADARERLAGVPVVWIGVRCPMATILERRSAGAPDRRYLGSAPDGTAPPPVRRWQDAVHAGMTYGLEIDTSTTAPEAAAGEILARLDRLG